MKNSKNKLTRSETLSDEPVPNPLATMAVSRLYEEARLTRAEIETKVRQTITESASQNAWDAAYHQP